MHSARRAAFGHRLTFPTRDVRGRALVFAASAVVAACAQVPPTPSEPGATTPAATTPGTASPSRTQTPARPRTLPEAGSSQRGKVSLYGAGLAGKPTASGALFDPEQLTMAHRTLPFGTRVRVTNLENRKSVEVIVNDRGPFVAGRIADLSAAAARHIGMTLDGVVDALLEVLQPAAP
jgi:rare lipoprotein A